MTTHHIDKISKLFDGAHVDVVWHEEDLTGVRTVIHEDRLALDVGKVHRANGAVNEVAIEREVWAKIGYETIPDDETTG